jgi:hypothetical protein
MSTSQMQKYTLQQTTAILFAGFNYVLTDETINVFNFLTAQIGSSAFINNNVFQKREREPDKDKDKDDLEQGFKLDKKKKKGNKGMEVLTEDWDNIRSFQATKIEQKSGLETIINKLKLAMSKLSKDRYLLCKDQIVEALTEIIEFEPDPIMLTDRIGNIMFDVILSNKTLLKLYSEMYTDLLGSYDWLMQSLNNRFIKYLDLFQDMRYFDPDQDYDKFCDMNVVNERRKLTSQLFVYLSLNGIIPRSSIYELLVSLLRTMAEHINLPDKKFEVDEIAENMAILFNKEIMKTVEDSVDYDKKLYIINKLTIVELVTVFAKSKAKDYRSLSNKSIFKCMDLVEM